MRPLKVLFVEPPKDTWFVMGEYLPPPLGILQLAAYAEEHCENVDIEVLDCQAANVDWRGLEKRIENVDPNVVIPSSLATCNAYTTLRAVETAKAVNQEVVTVVGGQHFTATVNESLAAYPEIDVVIRGEGEETLAEVLRVLGERRSFSNVQGISFPHNGAVYHAPDRPLLTSLDQLPYPGYHFVADVIEKYHYKMMADGRKRYALIEGSRGCSNDCSFCTQCVFRRRKWRSKSPKRIADEMQHVYEQYGMEFQWLTDDNFGLGTHTRELCGELIGRGLSQDVMWFMQARCDDVSSHKNLLPVMRKAGLRWILTGVESPSERTLAAFNKKIQPEDAKNAISLLKRNDIFSQAMLIIGERRDSAESIARLSSFADELDPDLAIFTILTPFPGTRLYDDALSNGWIEDRNWAHYDMTHAIMPTEHLSRLAVQEELYNCYRSFYGSFSRRLKGMLSTNALKRKTYRYLAGQGLTKQLKDLFWRPPDA
ncbi:MAG: B12-binding domain-containing radical SAM protein [Halobacteriota archaeon]